MDRIDTLVVGAGIIGLAVARALALRGREVLVLEQERQFGTGASSRNSEVIHAGLYYAPGSLKARACVDGRRQLYEFCERTGVRHRRCGKLIIATDDAQRGGLEKIAATAAANGVGDLRLLDRDDAWRFEPALSCCAALLSPSTGIIDSHHYMLALLGDAEDHGARIVFRHRVGRLRPGPQGIEVFVEGATVSAFAARWVINCAGLDAPAVALSIEDFPADRVPSARYAKGSYFTLTGRAPFSHLIYPVPEPGGLGVHLTLDLGGRARFGPDVEWVSAPDYAVDPARAHAFYARIRKYWPGLPDGSLAPGYAGVRPKIAAAREPAADFRISGPAEHGVRGIVNLFGIESPGLTASLALATHVADLATE